MQQAYEQLMDALEDLMENDNGFYSEPDIKYATRIHNRVERLYKTVINLRDYITQLREAYQTQIDIGLNSIMKVFTVLTAIFLPLTLLVGWYGMNFESIAEFGWKYGYAMVIIISAAIVVACLVFFKRKKWF
jgi:magnesium transporter